MNKHFILFLISKEIETYGILCAGIVVHFLFALINIHICLIAINITNNFKKVHLENTELYSMNVTIHAEKKKSS